MQLRIDEIRNFLKEEPDDSFLNYALALEYLKLGDNNKAITIIETILDRDANYLGAYYQLGQLYEQLNQIENAKSIYSKGMIIARQQKNTKTAGELSTALVLIEN